MFSVFLGSHEQPKFFKYPVALWSVIGKIISGQNAKAVVYIDIEYHPADTRFNNISYGKNNKCIFAHCFVGGAGKKSTVDSILNLKYIV